ncbi:MAG: VOC family virulence protein [Actinomycetales bacterium]|nr:MAG: VOC family virulence protein [Actinomycetales bacterium]
MTVNAVDHVVLNVKAAHRSRHYCAELLPLPGERDTEWERGDVGFLPIRITDTTIIDLIEQPRGTPKNVDHMCLVVEPLDWDDWPGNRTIETEKRQCGRGARGLDESIYVRNQGDNLVELRWYRDDTSRTNDLRAEE